MVTQYYVLLWMVCDRNRIWGDYVSLHRGNLEDISSERVVEVLSRYITHGRHTRINTSVGTISEHWWSYKNLYVLYFKIYTYYKQNTYGL